MSDFDFTRIKSFKDLKRENVPPDNEKNNQELSQKLKKKADRAFGDGKFTKAYSYYNQLVLMNPNEYDTLACLIGTALNLGFLDEVFSRSDDLIALNDTKAQGYYLKGIANDILFNFEHAIDLFLKALEFEKDHAKLIVKNLTKTISKYVNANDFFQLEDSDEEPESIYILKLIEVTDFVIKNRKIMLAIKIMNYVESLETKNYLIKTEFLLTSGNLFKITQNYDKALLAFEECLYLATLNNDFKLKVKALVNISSCYLQISDLHKVIYYYHKILDIEYDLTLNNVNKQASTNLNALLLNDEVINLELRIAVRQNLFTAHYRLGKLRLCCYYLDEMIAIIDNHLDLNFDKNTSKTISDDVFEFFEYVQIKMDASIELCKFFVMFKEFIKLEILLNKLLDFVEAIIEKAQSIDKINEKPFNIIKQFKIKCYSYMSICQTGLREFRFGKLCKRKCLKLLDTEYKIGLEATNPLASVSDTTFESIVERDLRNLSQLKIECLLNAAQECQQMISTFKEMKSSDSRILTEKSKPQDAFSINEINTVVQAYEERIKFSKEAYMLSKSIIDPNLIAQVVFEFAMSLYDNELYQSAGYYFNEVLSISTILLDSIKSTEDSNDYLTDIKPDYHLEASVYFSKCQLLINYYQSESCVNASEKKCTSEPTLDSSADGPIAEEEESTYEAEPFQLEKYYTNLSKTYKKICRYIFKWKLTETNRASFKFNMAEKEKLKEDTDCERLKKLLEISTESLIYVCYKMQKYEDCVYYLEHSKYLLNLDTRILTEKLLKRNMDPLKLIETENVSLIQDFAELMEVQKQISDPLVIFKFIFDCKLFYAFYVEPDGLVTLTDEIKMSLLYNKNSVSVDEHQRKLNQSEFDYFSRKFQRIQSSWILQHLSEYECRDICGTDIEIKQVRQTSRAKEKRFFESLNGKDCSDPQDNKKSKDFVQDLIQNSSDRLKKTEAKTWSNCKYQNTEEEMDYMLRNVLNPVFIETIFKKREELTQKDLLVNILIDSQYTNLLTYTLNEYNFSDKNECKIVYNVVLDSFLLSAYSTLTGLANDQNLTLSIQNICQNIKNSPRKKPISKKITEENSVRILKSNVIPRYTSHPRLVVQLLNEEPDSDYIQVRNDHVERAKHRLDASVGTLISETYSGTDSKTSTLQVIDYKQVYKTEKCSVIGCPDIPKAYIGKSGNNKFLKNGFSQLCKVAKLLHAKPIFAADMTKKVVMDEFEISKIIFLSTFSSNESDTSLICAETPEYPSSGYEIDKYCKLNSQDLNLINMDQCDLLVLNCYSTSNHVPRTKLAKKFLSRGCKNVLFILSPLTDDLLMQFYMIFFYNLKEETNISIAYNNSISTLLQENIKDEKFPCHNALKNIINSAFCLIGSKHIKVSINQIAKTMVQSNIDSALDSLQSEKNYLNVDQPLSILSGNFKPWLEKTLVDLQILFKLIMHQLIADTSPLDAFKANEYYRNIFFYLYDLVSKSIYYMKNKKIEPEELSHLLMNNKNAENIIICLGFNTQKSTVYAYRDLPDKKFVTFPDSRFLDLNMRTVHILNAMIELCFEQSIESTANKQSEQSIHLDEVSYINQFYNGIASSSEEDKVDYKIKMIVFNLQALLPIEDTNLLTCLIDIIALTKFSSEIILALTDHSVYYAFNFYEKVTSNNNREFSNLLNKDIDNWCRNNAPDEVNKNLVNRNLSVQSGKSHTFKFSRTNKVANFLFSIGFEIVGDWLRFNDIQFYRRILELMLKFFTSFAIDRDMTLYKELNINVMGQRSAVTRERYSFIRAKSGLTTDNGSKDDQIDYFKTLVAKPWSTIVESQKEMILKLDFLKNFSVLSRKLSNQRTYALKHYLEYTSKQHALNVYLNDKDEAESTKNANLPFKKVKFKSGGDPAKDRHIVNEKYKLTHEQINQIRKLSFLFCQKSMLHIDVDMKEKKQKLMLPLIKTKVYNL